MQKKVNFQKKWNKNLLCEQNNRNFFNIFKILNLDLTKNSGGQVFFYDGAKLPGRNGTKLTQQTRSQCPTSCSSLDSPSDRRDGIRQDSSSSTSSHNIRCSEIRFGETCQMLRFFLVKLQSQTQDQELTLLLLGITITITTTTRTIT